MAMHDTSELWTTDMPTTDQLIEYLRSFQRRKGMYVEPVTVDTVRSFLTGFAVGCSACGFRIERERWWAAQETRGWKRQGEGPIPQMQAAGMTEEGIMDELVEIEIEILRQQETART